MGNGGAEIKTTEHFFLAWLIPCQWKNNLLDELCLIDIPVISFDEEFLLNALLYG